MNRSVVYAVLWTLVGAAAASAFFLLLPLSPEGHDPWPVVRSYDTGEQMDDAMTEALARALDGRGRVTAAPNGQLLITASGSVQAQLPPIIASMTAKARPPQAIRFEAWLIVADKDGRPIEDPAFEDVRPALLEIAKGDRAARFRLRESASLATTSGRPARNETLEVHPRLRKREDGTQVIATELQIGNVKTYVQLIAGALTVLTHRMEEKNPGTAYYIIRASL